MKKIAGGVFCFSLFAFSVQPSLASDWGCQVILCLSNPGGPMQYGECVAPIKKLYKRLARGKSFPSCSGAGYSVSQPVYDPYTCETGRLSFGYNPQTDRQVATCRTTKLVERPMSECEGKLTGGEGIRGGDRNPRCYRYEQLKPIVHEKPNRVTVTIDGSGKQTIRY